MRKKGKRGTRKGGDVDTLAAGERADRGGKPKDKDREGERLPKRRLAVYVEADLFRRLNLRKAETDRSLSDLVSEAVEKLLAGGK